MYRFLAKKLSNILRKKHINQDDINLALQEVEKALIDADVAYEAIDAFKSNFSLELSEAKTVEGLDPQAQLMQEVRRCLLALLTSPEQKPELIKNKLHTIMMAGLQGAGKTTTCAKIAKAMNANGKLKVLMCSTDVYRPAAMAQLQKLANDIGVDYFECDPSTAPLKIAQDAFEKAKQQGYDLFIIDTAGRLNIDQERMEEAHSIAKAIQPQQCLYVVDSMIGQSALTVAKTFNEMLPLSGVVLTKIDSDTKGGVALSVRHVTQKPILWMGVGEHIDQLEAYDPERIVDQLLDMGDIRGLVKKAQTHINQKEAETLSARMQKGQFTLDDMLKVLSQIESLGGARSIMQMLPGAAQMPQAMLDSADDGKFKVFDALIKSMTIKERRFPALVLNQASRRSRVIKGSGRNISEFNELKKAYTKIEKMMQKMQKGKFKQLFNNFMDNMN